MTLEHVEDPVGRAVGLVNPDAQAGLPPEARLEAAGEAVVPVEDQADLPRARNVPVDRREGMDGDDGPQEAGRPARLHDGVDGPMERLVDLPHAPGALRRGEVAVSRDRRGL